MSRRRGTLLLVAVGGAVLAYVVAAWAVTPGFFDGLTPPAPYRWIHPPAELRQGNQQPLAGTGTVTLDGSGSALPGTAFTEDGQATLSWTGGTWKVPGKRRVTLRLTPERSFPATGSMRTSTNVYCVTGSAPIAAGHHLSVTLAYSDAIARAPQQIYEAAPRGHWQGIGTSPAPVPYTISAQTSTLGCFVAGAGSPPAPWYEQRLPLVAAALAVVVVAGGGTTVLVRRRRRRGAPA